MTDHDVSQPDGLGQAGVRNTAEQLADGPGWPSVQPSLSGPLAGVRVLDLSRVLAGPFATMVLGDLGADVVKIERPGSGDDTRSWGPPFHGDDATYFLAINRNRRSVTLDLRSPLGHAVVTHLIGHADIVVENFLPPALDALGLSDLRDAEVGPTWVSVRGASSTGPAGAHPGYDATVQAKSGLMSVTGHQEAGPTKVGVAIADVVTGLYAAVAALAGLTAKHRNNEGRLIEVPLLESAISALVNQTTNVLIAGAEPSLMGNDHPNLTPYGVVQALDGPLMIGAGNDAQFARLCAAIERPELASDPDFRTNEDRIANRARLSRQLSDTFCDKPVDQWVTILTSARLPCAPVNTIAQALGSDHIAASGLVRHVHHPAGPIKLVASPLLIDGVRPDIVRHPPVLGEHTEEVLRSLGLDDPTISSTLAPYIR